MPATNPETVGQSHAGGTVPDDTDGCVSLPVGGGR